MKTQEGDEIFQKEMDKIFKSEEFKHKQAEVKAIAETYRNAKKELNELWVPTFNEEWENYRKRLEIKLESK